MQSTCYCNTLVAEKESMIIMSFMCLTLSNISAFSWREKYHLQNILKQPTKILQYESTHLKKEHINRNTDKIMTKRNYNKIPIHDVGLNLPDNV